MPNCRGSQPSNFGGKYVLEGIKYALRSFALEVNSSNVELLSEGISDSGQMADKNVFKF
jgi:hypothetical protein